MTILVELTEDQQEQVNKLCMDIEECGAVFAQVYVDGTMRVDVLSPEQTMRVQAAIGRVTPGDPSQLHRYGRDAHGA